MCWKYKYASICCSSLFWLFPSCLISTLLYLGLLSLQLINRKAIQQKVTEINSITRSHAHTAVWKCCKDDQQSRWKMLKFDQQLPLNPVNDRYQIWYAWLCNEYLSPRKNWAQSVKGFFLPDYAKWTLPYVRYPIRLFTRPTFLVLPIAYSRYACLDFNA